MLQSAQLKFPLLTHCDDQTGGSMPSASPLYNYPGMTGDSDCPYRVPGPEEMHGSSRLANGYDPFQCLSAMAEQNFPGNYPSPGQPCPPPPQHYPPMHGQMTPYHCVTSTCVTSTSPCHYYTSSSPAFCMYNSANQQAHGQPRPPCDVTSPPPTEQNSPNKKCFPYAEEMYESEQEGLLSWTRKHPEHWSNPEVLDWLFYSAQERGLDMRELRGEAFQSVTGARLCRMTSEDFLSLEPKYGKLLFEMFKKLLNGVLFTKPTEVNPADCQDMAPFSPESCDASRDPSATRSFQTPPSYHVLRKPEHPPSHGGQQMYPPPGGCWKTERPDTLPCDVIDITSYDFDLNDPPMIQATAGQPTPDYEMYQNGYPGGHGMMRPPCLYPDSAFPPQLPRRRPGRPRVKSLPDDQSRATKDKKVKNQHLWEFIYEALLNPLYNPQFLRWENQRDGVFRFVQSEAVAQLWGTLKNNENMTYEKLSRAMRHYYKRGILERVEGRRLVYKFSRKAMERVRDKRHNSI